MKHLDDLCIEPHVPLLESVLVLVLETNHSVAISTGVGMPIWFAMAV